MMTGHVSSLHALLPVRFRLPTGPEIAIDFVVDTGFTGQLCLPPEAIAAGHARTPRGGREGLDVMARSAAGNRV